MMTTQRLSIVHVSLLASSSHAVVPDYVSATQPHVIKLDRSNAHVLNEVQLVHSVVDYISWSDIRYCRAERMHSESGSDVVAV